ncbi:MAG: DUF1858 domain-containing protein [Bacillota bacterium]|nr:DUF1858 domain-containing protein [Bacillota bacterium]
MKITKDMIIADVIMMDRGVVPIFFRHGLHCMGCVMANHESIEEAAVVHNLDLDALMHDLNVHFQGESATSPA